MTIGQVLDSLDFTGSHELQSSAVADAKTFVGDRIRVLMRERGLSQVDVARRADVDQSYVSKLLKGQMNATLDTIDTLARAIGVSAEHILSRADDAARTANVEGFRAVTLRMRPLAAGEPLVTEPDPERDSSLAFREDLLVRRGYRDPLCFRVGRREESMAPLILPNDVVLLDQNPERRTKPAPGRIFAVNFAPLTNDPGGAVKRLEIDRQWLIVSSENVDKDRYPTRAHDVRGKNLLDIIKGEVVWFGRYMSSNYKGAIR